MSDTALTLRQTGYELLGATRNPRVLVFTFAFPIVLLVLFNSICAGCSNATTPFAGGHMDTKAYFTAGILAYAIMMSAFSTMAISLTTQRESGLLKRFRGTPMPAWTFVASQILRSIALVVLMVAIFLLIGHFAFSVHVRSATLPGLIVFLVLGTATMCTLGIALTAITTTADSASTIAPFSAVILSFISGVFVPISTLPHWLASVGNVFPLARLAHGLQTALATGTKGSGLVGEDLAVLGLWLIVGVVVAARSFRWEPRGA